MKVKFVLYVYLYFDIMTVHLNEITKYHDL